MSSCSELPEETRAGINEISVENAHAMLRGGGEGVRLVDVRSRDHVALGYIKGAALIPADELEVTARRLLPDKNGPILLYCESGRRSLLAALALKGMGYKRVSTMAGGMTAWRETGYEIENETLLTQDQLTRYSRQMLLPEVGAAGQIKLLNARVLLVGAGGLGSSAALYLAAAGVGVIGIADFDRVEKSNLGRQVIHATGNAGKAKTESAREGLRRINPGVRVIAFQERMTPENIGDILKDFDILLDGSDSFQTKYLLNDAAFFAGKPYIFGGALRTEGQAAVFFPKGGGPCLRCMLPQPPPPDPAQTCSEVGVLGVVPGQIGLVQAAEALKLILQKGKPLIGRFLIYDALEADFRTIAVGRNPDCPLCGAKPTITTLRDCCEGAAAGCRTP